MVSKNIPHEMSITAIDDDEATQPYASVSSENALVPYIYRKQYKVLKFVK